MDKRTVADILEEMGTLMEIRGDNPFKCRAYHNASRIVGSLTQDLNELVQTKSLRSIKGIGEGLAETITALMTTGKAPLHDELKKSVPPGLLEMMRIQGLGPKKVKLLSQKLKITTVAALKQAATAGKLEKLEGFGAKTAENILNGIELLSKQADKHLYPKALEAARSIVESLRTVKGVKKIEVAGSLRRRKEVIGDIDLLISASASAAPVLMKTFVSHESVEHITGQGETKSSVRLKSGMNCDVRIVRDAEFPFALNYFTGSKEHNVEMRSRARARGWSLNEYGFSKVEGAKNVKPAPVCKDESDIYKALGLSYVPPELRENMGEFEAAEQRTVPTLVEEHDLRGTFHCHTTYSDGANTLEEMAKAAQKLGWEYLGIADHSKVAAYAGGLSPARVREQQKEIDQLNASFKGFMIFKGSEVDILADGSLDFSDSILASFDYVVASVHSKFNMTEAEATKRIIKAVKNKYVTILGHPTGRLLLSRDGYPVNMREVIKAAADYGKSIEINAHPMRLDLDWRLVKYAKEQGVRICINPDAHNVDGLLDVRYGVGIARKGWLAASDVVNAWPVKRVEQFFHSTRS